MKNVKTRWAVKEKGTAGEVKQLSESLNISTTLAELLNQRGIHTFEEAKNFFRPNLSDLHDPFLMKGMDKAVARIETALNKGEKILVYGDYDVDGTTAVSLMYSFLYTQVQDPKKLDYYIPDRYTEGYGVSFRGIDYASENGFSLIICLDCGIKAVDKVAYSNEKGIDFIICDHHRPGDVLPAAHAVLDPKREDCPYPYKELSGCGVGFKLIQAYALNNNISASILEEYLDLTAISIGCDIVPITGENRILAHYGLKRVNASPRRGLKTLVEMNQLKKELTISDLVFVIGPRINAAGRIEHGKKAVELLISSNEEQAKSMCTAINQHNTSRKEIDTAITSHALELIGTNKANLNAKSTVLYHEDWHKGVIGIVASRLIEKHYRPTILLTESNGFATGSARSVKGFDIYDAIEQCGDLLEQFGGHKYAAGLTLKVENVPLFSERFEQVVTGAIKDHQLIPEIEIDAEIDFSDITPKFYRILEQFAPFGPGNMKPVFLTKQVRNAGYSKQVGKEGLHLKLDVAQNGEKIRFSGIGFDLGPWYDKISDQNKPFSMVYTIEENEWNGKKNLQLNVKDIRMEE